MEPSPKLQQQAVYFFCRQNWEVQMPAKWTHFETDAAANARSGGLAPKANDGEPGHLWLKMEPFPSRQQWLA
jgi:hypothetical protein